jgi:hypothetical protein
MLALLLVALSAAVIPLNQRGIVGDWIFFTLFIAAVVAVLMALSVILLNWPTFLVPPSMRGEQGQSRNRFTCGANPVPPSNHTP